MSEENDFDFQEPKELQYSVGEAEEYARRMYGNEHYEAMLHNQRASQEADLAVSWASVNRLNSLSYFWTAVGSAIIKLFDLETDAE